MSRRWLRRRRLCGGGGQGRPAAPVAGRLLNDMSTLPELTIGYREPMRACSSAPREWPTCRGEGGDRAGEARPLQADLSSSDNSWSIAHPGPPRCVRTYSMPSGTHLCGGGAQGRPAPRPGATPRPRTHPEARQLDGLRPQGLQAALVAEVHLIRQPQLVKAGSIRHRHDLHRQGV